MLGKESNCNFSSMSSRGRYTSTVKSGIRDQDEHVGSSGKAWALVF